jgi:hypothetical protein
MSGSTRGSGSSPLPTLLFFLAFLIFTLRLIRRGPGDLPAHALPSGSLKRDLRPEIAGVQPYLGGAE